MVTGNNSAKEGGKGLTRRGFLRIGVWASLAVLAIEGLGATVASLWPKAESSTGSRKVRVGKPADFPVGSITHFAEGGFFVSHVDAGFLAMSHVCTHLGCIVPWVPNEKSEDTLASQGRFNCPCHGGIYDRYGLVKAGPPLRPMDYHPITLEGDTLVVDTGVTIQRQAYNESQVLKV